MYKKVAVLLAGGKGSRLKPYTLTIPKPLVPVGECPILEIIIRQLKKNDFTDIYMAVNHQANLIEDYFENGKRWGINIKYFLETKALGTMGPLCAMGKYLPPNFIVMNGDVLTDLDYNCFFEIHKKSGNIFTISGKKREEMIDYGVLHINEGTQLCGFEEKPLYTYTVSMGIYAVSKKVLHYIPEDTHFGFDDLMLTLLEHKQKVGVNEFSGYWNDIGRPSDYMQAIEDFNLLKDTFL